MKEVLIKSKQFRDAIWVLYGFSDLTNKRTLRVLKKIHISLYMRMSMSIKSNFNYIHSVVMVRYRYTFSNRL